MFGKNLIIGLTTILAWVPATVLVIFAFLGLIGGIANAFTLPITYTLHWILLSLGGILGYIALSSLSWGLSLPLKFRLYFLISGVSSLSWVYWRGLPIEGELFKFGPNVITFFLFTGPLLFGVFHIFLHFIWLRRPNAKAIKNNG